MDDMNRTHGLTAGQPTSNLDSEETSGSSALETFKDTVAGKLHAAADVIQEKAGRNQNSTAAAYAGQAATWLDGAAEYVREADPQKIKSELQSQVRRNPGRSLLIAGAAGLFLGFLIRR
jgi:ElaB/YqjD/DUF883 family membrane-anchored ribosome-binding protein